MYLSLKLKIHFSHIYKVWLTGELKYHVVTNVSYVRCRGFKERNVKLRYNRYCKILKDVTKEQKLRYYVILIS